jgi:hypothetical protein
MQKVVINPSNWKAIGKTAKALVEGAAAHVKLEAPGTVWLHQGKTKTIVGYGAEFKITGPAEGYELSASQKMALFERSETTRMTVGDPYTNAEKEPLFSPAESIVRQGLRQLEIREREAKRAIRLETLKFEQKRKAEGLQERDKLTEIEAEQAEIKEQLEAQAEAGEAGQEVAAE